MTGPAGTPHARLRSVHFWKTTSTMSTKQSRLAAALFLSIVFLVPASIGAQPLNDLAEELRQSSSVSRLDAFIYAVENDIPIRKTESDGAVLELQGLENGHPVYYRAQNAMAAATVGVQKLWPDGSMEMSLTGKNCAVGIWDEAGVRTTHQELTGRATQKDIPFGLSDHATHVSGTMIASGVNAAAKGMAPEARVDAYDWNDDTAEMAAAAARGLYLSNHSYGIVCGWANGIWWGDPKISAKEDYCFGFYNSWSKAFDEVAYNAPNYLIVKSAGNSRGTGPSNPSLPDNNGGATGYDTLPAHGSTAKNTLVVGAVEDIPNGYAKATDVVMTSFSSWGPCDDGRIKPDIVANGSQLLSCLSTGNTAYGSMSGTSMAAPNVTGALALLHQHYTKQRLAPPRSSMMRALVIHTASEAGLHPGPDYACGWGLLNASAAAEVITKAGSGAVVLRTERLANGGVIVLPVVAQGGNVPLKVTIAWTDPSGTPPAAALDPITKMLVNDVDLRVGPAGGVSVMPWVLSATNPSAAAARGDNTTDNVEQVVIDKPQAGAFYEIRISHKGTLRNGSQEVSIVATGISPQLVNLSVRSTPTQGAMVIGTAQGATNFDAPVPRGSLVMLKAADQLDDLYFRQWSNASGTLLCANSNYNFIMGDIDSVVVAEYGDLPQGQYRLTVRSTPITNVPFEQVVRVEPVGGMPTYETSSYVTDNTSEVHGATQVTLRAPLYHEGYRFLRWRDAAGVPLGDSTTYCITISGDTTITAEYSTDCLPTYQVTVESEPLASVEIGGPFGGTTPYPVEVAGGSTVMLTAPAQAGSLYFSRWKNAAGNTLATSRTLTYGVTGNATVIAEFDDELHAGKAAMVWGLNSKGQLGDGSITRRKVPTRVKNLSGVVQVATGKQHTLALDEEGRVWAWGDNSFGQLGVTSATYYSEEPVNTGLTNIVSIAAGGYHSLAVRDNGRLYAWGYNSIGQLGTGDLDDAGVPVELDAISNVVQAAAGDAFTVALKCDGSVYTWGSNNAGQLGDNGTLPSRIPVQVNGLHGVVQVAAGASHALALTSGGVVWSWGANDWGQLGNGRTIDARTPVEVTSLSNVTAIAAGGWHSLARTGNGRTYAWGANWWGQLGNYSTVDARRPVEAAFTGWVWYQIGYTYYYEYISYQILNAVSLAGGAYHTAVALADGTTWTWGANKQGQLGNDTLNDSLRPVQATGVTGATNVACGEWHTVVVGDMPPLPPPEPTLPPGTLLSTGENGMGQLGLGDGANRNLFEAVTDMTDIVAIAAGDEHAMVLRNDGTVWTVGSNQWGQLGLGMGTGGTRNTFQEVPGLTNVGAIAAGSYISIAIKRDGTLWVCGRNTWGELGLGNSGNGTECDAFVQVAGDVVAAAGGGSFMLVQKSDGWLYAVGRNDYGQLGLGDTVDRHILTQVPLSNVAAFAAGGYHSMVILSDGTLMGAGNNTAGQLGVGNWTNRTSFTTVSGSQGNVTAVSCGAYHTLAMNSAGQLWVCGSNSNGQLGIGGGNCNTFQSVSGFTGSNAASLIDAGRGFYSLVVRRNGLLWATGANASGQLGLGDTDPRSAFTQVMLGGFPSALAAGDSFSYAIGTGKAKWTYMVYMNGDNDLEAFAIDSFLKMAQVGSTADVRIVVMLDRTSGHESTYGNWTDTRRGLVLAGSVPDTTWGESVGEKDMGDPQTLVGFVNWAQTMCPADNYALVLWNHGSGGEGDSDARKPLVWKEICYDDTDGGVLNIRDLESALGTLQDGGRTINVLTFDAGLMGMTEVAYALRNYADIMVASEDIVPDEGLPYDLILSILVDYPDLAPADLGMATTYYYCYYYFYSYAETFFPPMATIDLTQIDALALAIDDLASSLIANHVDDPDDIKARAEAVQQAVVDAVIYVLHDGVYRPQANGLSIYMPDINLFEVDEDYNATHVALAEDTAWGDFVAEYVNSMFGTWIQDAHASAQWFNEHPLTWELDSRYVDLYDFCAELINSGAVPDAVLSGDALPWRESIVVTTTTTSVVSTTTTSTTTSTTVSNWNNAWTFAPTLEPAGAESVPTVVIATPSQNGSEAQAASGVTGGGWTPETAGIVDNRDASEAKRFTRISGSWNPSTVLANRYGSDYQYALTQSEMETARARFTSTVLPAGAYRVYAWWPSNPDRSRNAAYEVHHAEGVTTLRVDQTQDGGDWKFLGTFTFRAGSHIVEVHNGRSEPGKFLCADAVRFTPAE